VNDPFVTLHDKNVPAPFVAYTFPTDVGGHGRDGIVLMANTIAETETICALAEQARDDLIRALAARAPEVEVKSLGAGDLFWAARHDRAFRVRTVVFRREGASSVFVEGVADALFTCDPWLTVPLLERAEVPGRTRAPKRGKSGRRAPDPMQVGTTGAGSGSAS
jgi:hypothetical protein